MSLLHSQSAVKYDAFKHLIGKTYILTNARSFFSPRFGQKREDLGDEYLWGAGSSFDEDMAAWLLSVLERAGVRIFFWFPGRKNSVSGKASDIHKVTPQASRVGSLPWSKGCEDQVCVVRCWRLSEDFPGALCCSEPMFCSGFLWQTLLTANWSTHRSSSKHG